MRLAALESLKILLCSLQLRQHAVFPRRRIHQLTPLERVDIRVEGDDADLGVRSVRQRCAVDRVDSEHELTTAASRPFEEVSARMSSVEREQAPEVTEPQTIARAAGYGTFVTLKASVALGMAALLAQTVGLRVHELDCSQDVQ